jgi:hypothetical protein
MLTKVEYSIVEHYARLACLARIFPFEWDKSTGRLSPTTSRIRLASVYVSLTVQVLYNIFAIVRLIPGNGYNYANEEALRRQAVSLVFHVFYIVVHTCLAACTVSALIYAEEWIAWFNQTIFFNKKAGWFNFDGSRLIIFNLL